MISRRDRRRLRNRPAPVSPLTRLAQFLTGWEAIIGASILLVLVILVQGVFHLKLPFSPSPTDERPPDPWGYISIPRSGSMKLVYVGDVSGGKSIDAPGAKQAVEFAVQEHGRVRDVNVDLQVMEDSCDPEQARARAQGLAADPTVLGVISAACEASSLAERAVFEEAQKMPYLNVSVTAPNLTETGSQVTFRLLWNEKLQGRRGAILARQNVQATRALLLHDGRPGSNEIVEEFRGQFRPQGGQIADARGIKPGREDWEEVLTEVRTLNPDLVYYAGDARTGGELLAFLRRGGYQGQFMGSDSLYRDPAYLLAGPDVEGTYATSMQNPKSAGYAFFKESYENQYGPIGPLAAEARDAAMLLLNAADVTSQAKPDGTLEIGRRGLVGILPAIPLEGVTGRVAFDANGDRQNVLIGLWKFENGEFRQVA